MESSRDNSFFRFKAFWAGLIVFLLAAIVLGLFNGLYSFKKPTQTLEEAAAAKRYVTRAEIDKAQEANFVYKEIEAGKKVQVPPHDVFELVGKQLVATKPAPVKDEKQVVPNSPTAKQALEANAAAGPVDYQAIDSMGPKVDEPVDEAVMAAGKTGYMLCMACHGQNGEGGPAGPAHAGSEWVTGPVSNLIRIQLRGLQGPITVKGEKFTTIPLMSPQSFQSDEQIAAVLTYVRNSFGNKASAVSPAQVKALRSEVGKPPLTEADLIKP